MHRADQPPVGRGLEKGRIEIFAADQRAEIGGQLRRIDRAILEIDPLGDWVRLRGEQALCQAGNVVVFLKRKCGENKNRRQPGSVDWPRKIEKPVEHHKPVALCAGRARSRHRNLETLQQFQEAHRHHASLRPSRQEQTCGSNLFLLEHGKCRDVHVEAGLLLAAHDHVAVLFR